MSVAAPPDTLEVPHGLRRYDNKKIKCRCGVCKVARRKYDRERYEQQGEQKRALVKARADRLRPQMRAEHKIRYAVDVRYRETSVVRSRKHYVDNKARHRANQTAYRQTPRGKEVHRVNYLRRSGAVGVATATQIEARVAYYGGKCAYCRGPYEHLDHVKAITHGGSNWPANLRPSCEDCNLRKGAQPWRQFLISIRSDSSQLAI